MGSLIEMTDVTKEYALGEVKVKALRNITTSIDTKEFVCLEGPSGSGKSTFLNVLGCLDQPTSGKILVDGKDVSRLSDDDESEFRNASIGFIFQSFNLIPVLDVFENVEFPLLFRSGAKAMPPRTRKALVEAIIEQVGLTKFIKHRSNELSGGQQQRVAIARALVTTPKLVLADELTANLDSENATKIIELMLELNEGAGTTFVFATHDPLVSGYARRTLKLKDGQLVHDTSQDERLAG